MSTVRNILVVDDNDFVRSQIVSYLKEAGFGTLEATEGNKALSVLNKSVVLAIVDLHMEPMDGFDFIAMMREGEYHIPVLVITGDQDANIAEKAQKNGANVVMLKPIQKAQLLSTVEQLLTKK